MVTTTGDFIMMVVVYASAHRHAPRLRALSVCDSYSFPLHWLDLARIRVDVRPGVVFVVSSSWAC